MQRNYNHDSTKSQVLISGFNICISTLLQLTMEHSEGVGENIEQLITRMLISLADTPVDARTCYE